MGSDTKLEGMNIHASKQKIEKKQVNVFGDMSLPKLSPDSFFFSRK
jgi:hypothetical protein